MNATLKFTREILNTGKMNLSKLLNMKNLIFSKTFKRNEMQKAMLFTLGFVVLSMKNIFYFR